MLLDMREVATGESAQGPALQQVLAEQLRVFPSSFIVVTSPEFLDNSGVGVMLQLLGACHQRGFECPCSRMDSVSCTTIGSGHMMFSRCRPYAWSTAARRCNRSDATHSFLP
jgi:hypothetical protein